MQINIYHAKVYCLFLITYVSTKILYL